jgi:hypothetical protein
VTVRVVHVASGREWRGGQRQVWLLARELARTGAVEQVVVTGAASELARRLDDERIPVHCARWTAGLDPRVLPSIVSESRSDHAVLHAHDAHALTLAGIGARLTGTPFIATRRVDFPLRRRGFWGRADRVIAISRAVAEESHDEALAYIHGALRFLAVVLLPVSLLVVIDAEKIMTFLFSGAYAGGGRVLAIQILAYQTVYKRFMKDWVKGYFWNPMESEQMDVLPSLKK